MVSESKISQVLSEVKADCIRNVSIIAHVDHGKTSLADCLISSNGLISARMAGKMRYLDNREDEQIRGITMKTSVISLLYKSIIVNLIDSPGHVDFSGEVSAALFISDVALLLIDVVEGICSQTEFLLRQSIRLNLDLILVFNKFDRLFVELKKTTAEAYSYIHRLMEQVNSCISQIISGTLVELENWKNMDETEQSHYFSFDNDNVVFASALHGYGFSLTDFATIWSPKLNIPVDELRKNLFTNCYISKGKIKPNASQNGKKNIFEQLVLQPLWEIHKCGLIDNDLDKLKMFASKMDIKLKSKRIVEAFDEFMRNWIPLSNACFHAIQQSQSPLTSFTRPNRLSSIGINTGNKLCKAISSCDENDIAVVFVAKILSHGENILAICRILSGSVKIGDNLFIIGDRRKVHSNERIDTKINGIFMLTSREKFPATQARAGIVCALEIEGQSFASVLCSEYIEESIKLPHEIDPLVRVLLHSEGTTDEWNELREKLRHLCALDSSIRVIEQKTGELALLAAGEVHLQKCLTDLFDMGQTNVKVSEPTVSFMETIIPSNSNVSLDNQIVNCNIRGDILTIALRAVPLPLEFTKLLERTTETLRDLRQGLFETKEVQLFRQKLLSEGVKWLKALRGTWWSRQSEQFLRLLVERIWAFGPPQAMCNVLFNAVTEYDRPLIWESNFIGDKSEQTYYQLFDQSIRTGFDLAVLAGPLCEEPMWGVAIVVESWTCKGYDDPGLSGSLITAMKNSCRAALNKQSLRLMSAMYKCNIQTNSNALGKVHAVLSQRQARITHEDVNQATGLFVVEAFLPIIESFSFCEQLRKKTSGLALGQLEFSHWEILPEDPFWEPTTEDEVELYGVKADSLNKVRTYVDSLRKRKGLLIDEPIVLNANKQRNLKRNR